jgi:signal peptide peptidase SppA
MSGQPDNPSGVFRDVAMLRYVSEELWTIRESVMDRMLEILARHSDGVKLSAEQIAAAIGKPQAADGNDERAPEAAYRESGATAFVTVGGVIAKHASMVNGVSQPEGSSCERIMADLAKARSNPRIQTVVLRLETPGGSAAGISDLADTIYAMNADYRMIAFGDDQACSGGVWLGSQCREFYCNKAAAVGSIGVIMVAADRSAQAKAAGVKYHVIKSCAYKGTAGAPVEFAPEDLQEMQDRVNTLHAVFVGEVARGRGLDALAVGAFADGRVFTGQQAVDLGLCDGVCAWEELLTMITQGLERPALVNTSSNSGRLAAQGDTAMTVQSDAAAKAASDKAAADAATQQVQAEALKTAQANGVKSERERIAAITSALPGETFAAVRQEAIDQGVDVNAAKALAFDVANKALIASAAAVTAAQTATATAKAEGERFHKLALEAGIEDPLPAAKDEEDIAGKTAAGADGGSGYEAKVASLVKAGKTENAARLVAGGEFPDDHQAWRKRQDAKRRKK